MTGNFNDIFRIISLIECLTRNFQEWIFYRKYDGRSKSAYHIMLFGIIISWYSWFAVNWNYDWHSWIYSLLYSPISCLSYFTESIQSLEISWKNILFLRFGKMVSCHISVSASSIEQVVCKISRKFYVIYGNKIYWRQFKKRQITPAKCCVAPVVLLGLAPLTSFGAEAAWGENRVAAPHSALRHIDSLSLVNVS